MGIPCISVNSIPNSVDSSDGAHHDTYFAYTFYAKYIVDSTAADATEPIDYTWHLKLNFEQASETDADISQAIWVMVFEDGEMTFHAEVGADGETETLPERSVTDIAYADFHLKQFLKDQSQLEVMKAGQYFNYYRLVPMDFVSEEVAAEGMQKVVYPNDIHKYTVVIWLEGDDPECTDELMGSAIGMNFLIKLAEEDIDSGITTSVTTPAE